MARGRALDPAALTGRWADCASAAPYTRATSGGPFPHACWAWETRPSRPHDPRSGSERGRGLGTDGVHARHQHGREWRGSGPGACSGRISIRRVRDVLVADTSVDRRACAHASAASCSQAAAGHRGREAGTGLEDPAVHAGCVTGRARRVVFGDTRLPLGVGQGRGHRRGQPGHGPPDDDGRDDQGGRRGQSADHADVARRQAALDAGAQCVSKADLRSAAISCAVRPSICQRSSMNATSPFLRRAMLGELGGYPVK